MSSSPATPVFGDRKPTRARIVWRWAAPLALILAVLLLRQLARLNPALVDRLYSRGIYLFIGRALSRLSGPFSFSLAETLLVGLPIAGLVFVLWRTRSEVRRGFLARQICWSRTREFFWFVAVFFFVFQLLFGLNYQRQSLNVGLQLSSRQPTAIELENISAHVIAETNRNYDVTQKRLATTAASANRDALYQAIETAFEETNLLGEAAKGGFAQPKPVYASRLMTRLGVAGVYSPFTAEPNYNRDQPETELPYSIAHEKAHQRGYAREDEANFIAFLVCVRSSDPLVRYSGYLRGLRVLAPLRATVPPERYGEIVNRLLPGVRADLQANAQFWQRSRDPRLGRVADRANDTFLRANNVPSGIANYGEVVSLIIGYYLTYPPA